MELKNYMEDLVLEKLDDVMAQYPFCCTCDLCKRDIATLALNHLKPRYISSHKGDVYTRLDEMSAQYEVEVIQAIAQAIEVVHKNPRHAEEE
jgi:competence protein ComFB